MRVSLVNVIGVRTEVVFNECVGRGGGSLQVLGCSINVSPDSSQSIKRTSFLSEGFQRESIFLLFLLVGIILFIVFSDWLSAEVHSHLLEATHSLWLLSPLYFPQSPQE